MPISDLLERTEVLEVPKLLAKGRRIFIDFGRKRLRAFEGEQFAKRIHTRLPDIRVYHDVHLQPLTTDGTHDFTGGAFCGQTFLSELALRRGFGEKETLQVTPGAAVESTADGDCRMEELDMAWFGGILFPHFGHFLLESLARVESQAVVESDAPIVFFNPFGLPRLKLYMEGVFTHLRIDPARIVLCSTPLRIGMLKAQEPIIQLNGHVIASCRKVMKGGEEPHAAPHDSIYLSRSRSSVRRTVQREKKLEERLSASGLAKVVYPEKLSFEQQIATVRAASLVSGCEGSAFHTLMFVPGSRTFLMLSAKLPPPTYFLCDELIDGDSVYVRCDAVPQAVGDPRRTPWTLNVAKAYRSISEIAGRPPGRDL